MAATTYEFVIATSDGECHPVPGLELGVRYRYASAPSTWSTAVTDGDGVARLVDAHDERPIAADVFIEGNLCGSYDLADDGEAVVEV